MSLCTRHVEVSFPRDGGKLTPAQLELWLDRTQPCGACEACIAFDKHEAALEAEAEDERDAQMEAGHA